MKKILFIIFVLFILNINDVFAIPTSGYFDCEYKLKYYELDNEALEKNIKLKITNKDNAIKYDVEALDNSSKGVVSKIRDHLYNPRGKLVNYPTDISKFYSDDGLEWTCPPLNYRMQSIDNFSMAISIDIMDKQLPNMKDLDALELATEFSNQKQVKVDASSNNSKNDLSSSGNSSSTAGTGTNTSDLTNRKECKYHKHNKSLNVYYDKDTQDAVVLINGSRYKESFKLTADQVGSDGCPKADIFNYCPSKINNETYPDLLFVGKDCIAGINEAGLDYDQYETGSKGLDAGEKPALDAPTTDGSNSASETLSWNAFGQDISVTCSDSDISELLNQIKKYFDIIKTLVPIIIILLGSIDVVTALLSQDKELLRKATQKISKRIIAGVLIYFLPTIIDILLSQPGVTSLGETFCNIN